MLSSSKFIQQSLELHLFFARIMKEHSFFLAVSFTPKDSNYKDEADSFRIEFDRLLADAISLSDGVVSNDVVQSGEIVTPFTLAAEQASAYFTGVDIPTEITKAEEGLMGNSLFSNNNNNNNNNNTILDGRVGVLNDRAMELIRDLASFKAKILSDVLSCRIYTTNYPLLIDHILREARFYFQILQRLQKGEEIDLEKDTYVQEVFWNNIMQEHSEFIRGLLDPTEGELMKKANDFAREFDKLGREAQEAMDQSMPMSNLTEESINATLEISKFKAQGTQGILECKIKSIIIPLLADHTLREANHYLRLLKVFSKEPEENYEED